jgi:hypothetical protein
MCHPADAQAFARHDLFVGRVQDRRPGSIDKRLALAQLVTTLTHCLIRLTDSMFNEYQKAGRLLVRDVA